VELVPHADAGDRFTWSGNQDARPLTDLGWRQAKCLAKELALEPVNALFASPALRARQTLEPLSGDLGMEVRVLPDLSEKLLGEDLRTMAARGVRVLSEIRRDYPTGRVIACSHGDIIPAIVELLAGESGANVESMEHRGQRYRVRFQGPLCEIELRETSCFPL
jgi:8-oxo-dGTP diphosphatase